MLSHIILYIIEHSCNSDSCLLILTSGPSWSQSLLIIFSVENGLHFAIFNMSSNFGLYPECYVRVSGFCCILLKSVDCIVLAGN